MIRIAVLLFVASFVGFQLEPVDEKTALIEKLFELSRLEEVTKISQIEGFKMGLDMSPAVIPDKKKAKIIAAGEKIMEELMPWPEMKADFIKLYDKHYTVDQLKNIVELCEDPRYSTFITKQIEMVGPAMELGQKYGKRIVAPMMKETMRIMQEEPGTE